MTSASIKLASLLCLTCLAAARAFGSASQGPSPDRSAVVPQVTQADPDPTDPSDKSGRYSLILKVCGNHIAFEKPTKGIRLSYRARYAVVNEEGMKIGDCVVRQFSTDQVAATFSPLSLAMVVRPGCRVLLVAAPKGRTPNTAPRSYGSLGLVRGIRRIGVSVRQTGRPDLSGTPTPIHRSNRARFAGSATRTQQGSPFPEPIKVVTKSAKAKEVSPPTSPTESLEPVTAWVTAVAQNGTKVKVSPLPQQCLDPQKVAHPVKSLWLIDEAGERLGEFLPPPEGKTEDVPLDPSSAWGSVKMLPNARHARVGDRLQAYADASGPACIALSPSIRAAQEPSWKSMSLPVRAAHFDSSSAKLIGESGVAMTRDYSRLTVAGRSLSTNITGVEVGLSDRVQVGYGEHRSVVIGSSGKTRVDDSSQVWSVAYQLKKSRTSATALRLTRESVDSRIVNTDGATVSELIPAPTRVWSLTAMRSDRVGERLVRHLNLMVARAEVPVAGFVTHTAGGRIGFDYSLSKRWEAQGTAAMYIDFTGNARGSSTFSGALGYKLFPGMQLQVGAFIAPRGLPFAGSFFTESSALNANELLISDTIRKLRNDTIGSVMLRLMFERNF